MASDLKQCHTCGKLVFDGETVALPIADYVALLSQADQGNAAQAVGIVPFGHKNRIQRDPELMRFIVERLDQMSQADIVAACRSRFGVERSPSPAGLNRFIKGLSKTA